MITVKNRLVTFTGKDARDLAKAAKLSGKTPRQFLISALTTFSQAAINGQNTTTVNSGPTIIKTVKSKKSK